jgi:hypothetical protein
LKRLLLILLLLVLWLNDAELAYAGESTTFDLKPESLAGDWLISDTNPSGTCKITLEVSKSPFGYPAYAFGCNADDIMQVIGWHLRNTSIVLIGNNAAPIVLLRIRDRNHFDGRAPSGRHVVLAR